MAITIRFEPLSHLLLTGLVELAFEAWQELEYEHVDLQYAPDWEAYQRDEETNFLRFIALREDNKLIGYASILIDTERHREKLLFASFRDIYVKKEKRGHAVKLVHYIEMQLSELGVKRVLGGERVRALNNAGKFWEINGYELQERIYGKTIN